MVYLVADLLEDVGPSWLNTRVRIILTTLYVVAFGFLPAVGVVKELLAIEERRSSRRSCGRVTVFGSFPACLAWACGTRSDDVA